MTTTINPPEEEPDNDNKPTPPYGAPPPNNKDTTNQKEKEDGSAARTTPPAKDKDSRETESLKQENDTPETLEVTPIVPDTQHEQDSSKEAPDTEDLPEVTDGDDLETAPVNVDEVLSVRDQILAARKKPEEVAGLLETQTEQLNAPVHRKLPDAAYWRVRNEPGWEPTSYEVLLFRRKDAGTGPEFLLVAPDLEPLCNNNPRVKNLVAYYYLAFVTDTRGRAGWWAVPSRSDNEWHVSARNAMRRLMNEWGMVKTAEGAKGYSLEKPMDDLGDPSWPAGCYEDWYVKGFSDKILDSEDHPVLKDLLGRL